jgi:hypothetical protein
VDYFELCGDVGHDGSMEVIVAVDGALNDDGWGGARRPIRAGHRSSVRLNEYGVITPIDDSGRVLTEGSWLVVFIGNDILRRGGERTSWRGGRKAPGALSAYGVMLSFRDLTKETGKKETVTYVYTLYVQRISFNGI